MNFDAQYAARTFLLMYPPTPIDDCETADALIAYFNEAVEARERVKDTENHGQL